jgi:hypothetical protein
MVKITFEINDKLNDKFRKAITTNKGLYRGAIQQALIEAINDWIQKNKSIKKNLKKRHQDEEQVS